MNKNSLRAALILLAMVCELYAAGQYVQMNESSASTDNTVEVFNQGLAELQASHKE